MTCQRREEAHENGAENFIAALALALGLTAGSPSARSGHFVGTPTCEDTGTVLSCDGKVAGLGGTTFEIRVSDENALADVTCTNPGGNVVPGQSFEFTAQGTTGVKQTPRNGQFRFSNLETTAPTAPARSCPNPQWTATVTDVEFSGTTATVCLFEGTGAGAVQSQCVQVPIP